MLETAHSVSDQILKSLKRQWHLPIHWRPSGGRAPVVTLLLAGFAVSTTLSYFTYFLVVLDDNFGLRTRVLASWLTGVISVSRWTQLEITAAMIGCGLIPAFRSRRLNTLARGDDYARQIGVQVERTHLDVILAGSQIPNPQAGRGSNLSLPEQKRNILREYD